ncbi:MAG TPA: hypothetical protein VMD27_12640 [Candidatus Aquilonibacter sp.]|nr:hypothetical protein [Candidatus Aquilonibacter sp.]
MKTTAGVLILLAAIAFTGVVHAQPSNDDQILPVIQMQDVPITTAIESLARNAGINYILDPKLFPTIDSDGKLIPEPTVTFRLKNISARDALTRMLNLRNIAMMEDPVTGVTRIARAGQPANVVNGSLLEMETNTSALFTNSIIPLIQFQDVPLDTVLKVLIGQSSVKAGLDPQISASNIILTLRWQNITAKQAIIAICQNYDLDIVKDAATGAIEIKPKK